MQHYTFIVVGAAIATLSTVLCNSPTLLHERKVTDDKNSLDSEKTTGPQYNYNCNTEILLKDLRERRNKKLVRDFYQEVFGDKNVSAINKYISREVYIQHNPTIADGRESFKTAATEWFKDAPKETIDIQRISADGDLVWVHTKAINDGKLSSCIDIFRIHLGKIFEHWDVMQDVPEKSANPHPMF